MRDVSPAKEELAFRTPDGRIVYVVELVAVVNGREVASYGSVSPNKVPQQKVASKYIKNRGRPISS